MSAHLIAIGVTVDAECRECGWYACGEPFHSEEARSKADSHNREHHQEAGQ